MTGDHRAVGAVSLQAIPHLSQQTRAPEELFIGPQGLARARSWGADWIWLLAAGAVPRADALAQLLGATAPAGEMPPSVLAGAVVDPAGELLASHLPRANQQHPDLARVVGHHMLPIRSATFSNCLVAANCFARHGLPDEHRYGPYAAVAWSARALRDDDAAGYFVPSSVASLKLRRSRRAGAGSIPSLMRTVRAGVWTRGESLQELGAALGSVVAPRRPARR